MNAADTILQKISSGELRGIGVNAAAMLPGEVFFALARDQPRRIEAVKKALSAGAAAVVTPRQDAEKISHSNVFFADDIRAALLQSIKKLFLPDGVMPVLAAITGTNGKTSTAWYLSQILQLSGTPCACLGTTGGYIAGRNIPSRLTTPDVCEFYKFLSQAKTVGCNTVVFEYSSHALDQDRLLGPPIQFATFTNLTPDHLDYHGTMENYFLAKRKLFTANLAGGAENYAILNADDAWGKKLLLDPDVRRKKITYGFSPDADLQITQHHVCPESTHFVARWQGAEYQFKTQFLGLPNIYNIAAACANAILMGVPPASLPQVVSRLTAVPGRFETVHNNKGLRILVDYAHTPDALEKLLLNVRPITPGRVICVFGCGGNRDAAKRPIMGAIAEKNSDLPIITSDNPRDEDPETIISQILGGFSDHAKALAIPFRKTAILRALNIARPGDTVIIAGKGHESTQEIRGVFHPFSDREVVTQLLEKSDDHI